MPEGPEVETIRLGLATILKTKILDVKIANHKKYLPQREQLLSLKGSSIDKIIRKGKFLIWFFKIKNDRILSNSHNQLRIILSDLVRGVFSIR